MRSGTLALCGVLAALAVTLLLFTATPVATVALAALAGLTVIPTVVAVGNRAALAQYAAVAVLAWLLVPAWDGKLLYIGFFGYYPLVKAAIEARRFPRLAEWGLKIALFAVALAGGITLAVTVFSVPWPAWHPAAYAGAAATAVAVFAVYDIGLTQLISGYIRRLHPTVQRLFRL